MKKRNILKGLVMICMVFASFSCESNVSSSLSSTIYLPPEIENPSGVFTQKDFLKVDGKLVKKDYGTGEEIILRGTNAGGYLVIEQWMTAIGSSNKVNYYDHKLVTETFVERFGKETTLELWEYYRSNFWTELDFQNCADMNMNVIRLPFSYMSVDPEYNNVRKIDGEKYNFYLLDKFVADAAKYGMYTILDCHGAYGSQNGQDHSGESQTLEDVDFYTNEDKMNKTIDMWVAIAKHFKDNPAVAGYDLLNEPGEKAGFTTTRHWQFYDRVYEAIREVDKDHIVIFESCWDGANLPSPRTYGWSNCMYSFHNYSGEYDADKNLLSMRNKIEGVEKMNFNVPFYMGEFNCYNTERSWITTLSLFNQSGWHWTSWTYKLNRTNDTSYQGWGIYYSKAKTVVPHTDNVKTIKAKWYEIDTAHDNVSLMRFQSTMPLYLIMKKYCGGEI